MTKLTLKITTLIILALSSAQLLAKSPWADEEPVVAEPVSIDDTTASQPAPADVAPVPAPEPVDVVQDEIAEPYTPATAEPVENFTPEEYTQDTQQGDVLDIDQSSDIVAVKILDFPRRGMSTDKVKNELGQPGEIISGIGQPPISRWVYDDRTVYFEYTTVLHVVAK